MKPAPFEYHCPDSLEEAVAILARADGDAKPLAGGQSLVPAMNFRLARPAVLVDLNRIASLAYIAEAPGGGLRIGSMTRQRALERSPEVARVAPLLAEALPWIAHPQIRNRGTVGGSLAHADPSAELPAVMAALDAQFVLTGPAGARTVPAAEFSTGLMSTVLASDELLTEIQIPPRLPEAGDAFLEVARRHGDFALVGVAVRLVLDRGGTCSSARITLLSVGEGPVTARGAAAALEGRAPDPGRLDQAARAAAEADIDPPGDLHATPAYRRQLARVLVRRALALAVERAGAGQAA